MRPFNPLDKRNLAISVAKELLSKPLETLPPLMFEGAGVYAIYYTGAYQPYELYTPIAVQDLNDPYATPIYVGKAVPAGARIGGLGLDVQPGKVLSNRLYEHAESIRQVANLDARDFLCRYLIVDDIWIPLSEALLITVFEPLWNRVLAGFGNHDPGAGRRGQMRSPWDTLHPGRYWSVLQQPFKRSEEDLVALVRAHFAIQRARPSI